MDSVWFEILVVILSVVLAIFLVVSIILVVKMIQISNTVKEITDHAEKIAEKAETAATFFEKTAGPMAIANLISNVTQVFSKKGRKK